MADETQRRVIYLEINASKAVDGSSALTRALAAVEKGATSAGGAVGALEAASVAAGGAAQRTALDLATSATAATNLNSAYRTTAGGALELARASTAAASSAQAQAAGFARLAEQRTVQASLAQTRALMDGVARSTANLTQMYGAATVATTTFASAQAQAAGYAKLAEQNLIAAATAKSRATMSAVEAMTPDQMKALYYGNGASATAPAPGRATGYMGTPGQTGLNAQQKVMLGYQLQDVGVSLIGGMNPFVVAAQQGPQISMLYGGVRNMLNAIPKTALVAGGAAVGGLAMGAILKEFSDANEALELQHRRLTALFGSGDQAAAVYRDIGKMASGTAISIAEATESVTAFGRATRDLGGSAQAAVELATMAEKLAQLSGSSKEEGGAARGALAAMVKDSTVSADQLRTVLGSVPQIADKIAAGLGVSVAQLKLMAQQGDVSGRQVFSALLTQTDAVNKEFEAMPKSLGFVLKSIGVEIGEMVTGLAAAVGQLTVIQSKADAIKAAQAANSNRPARATPRVIGNPGVDFSDAVIEDDFAAAMSASVRLGAAVTASADAAVLAASKLAQGLDPAVSEVKELHRGISDTEAALGKLQGGLTSFDAEKAAQETRRLTDNLQAMREKADAAGGAYYQALSAVQLRQQQGELGMTPGQRAYAANVSNLAKPGSGVSIEEAQTVVDAQQLQGLDDLIEKQRLQVTIQTAMAQAMRGGKKAADDMSVSMAILGISTDQLNKVSPEAKAKLEQLAELMREFNKQMRVQATIDASKPLIADLEGISAAMAVVEQGAYAMRRAEAAARAARDENGTGGLQMDVFDARQNLADLTMLHDLERSIDLTNALAAAAGNVAEQKRIQLDYDIKIAQLAAGPDAASYIAEGMRADFAAKANRERREGLADMQREVDLAQQQLDIIRSGAPDVTAQLAMLQKRNELLAKGADITLADNAKQIDLAGQKARLDEQIGYAKEASDATKRTWMNAFDGVQSYGADVFFDIFSGAELNGSDVAKSLKNIFIRAFAEIAAAAIIRPLIAPVFQAGQSLGIVPAGVGGAAWGGTPTAANSNGISLPGLGGGGGLGGLGNTFGGIGNWLNSPITPTSYAPGYGMAADYASLSGTAMPSGLTSGGMLGNMTWGQGLAGIASMGMGAYNLATSKSTAGKIGGGLGILGGGIGMAGAMGLLPMLGAAAGPIGMGLGLVGSLLPMLFGDSGSQRTHNSTNASLRYGGGNWYTTGGAYGPGANSGQTESALRGTTANIDAAFDLLGGVKDPSKVWGLNLNSWTAQGKDWSYTSQDTALVDPTSGNTVSWRMNEDNMMDTGSAQLVVRSILSGAVGEISDSMKIAAKAMTSFAPTLKEVAENITFVDDVYDRLGKGALTVRAQFRELEKQFSDMTATADKLGLALDPVIAEQKKATERLGQDYIDNLIDPIAAQLRAWQDEKASILANVDYIGRHTDVVVDMARINEALIRKEYALKDQLTNGAISQLEDAIARLMPGGNLANLDPSGTLAGMRASYQSTYAQAAAGDAGAIGRFGAESTAYAEYARSYFAGSAEYEAIRQQIVDALRTVQASVVGPTPAANGAAPATNGNDAQFQQLMATVQTLTEELRQERAESAQLRGLMTRLVANGSRAA